MDLETPLRSILASLGLELYDLELVKGTLNVVVTKAGGVDLEALTQANRAVSEWLDRRLRTADHFRSALGEIVTLRERRGDLPTRRLEGPVLAVSDDTVTLEDASAGRVEVRLDSLERARTVFQWGAEAKPSPSRGKSSTTSSKKG